MYYAHYSHIPESAWFWQDFIPQEIASHGNGAVLMIASALDKLQEARTSVGKPFIILSAYRDPLHNARVGGAPLSRHKVGDAFDIDLRNHDRQQLYQACVAAGFTGFGFYPHFLHVDCGAVRHWGEWV